MEFLQTVTPDTSVYMIGGFIFIILVLGLYAGSLIIRKRNLERELDLLHPIEAPEFEEVGGETVSP